MLLPLPGVRASVVDISHPPAGRPAPNEVLAVDANVWIFQSYKNASLGNTSHRQLHTYPAFLQAAHATGTTLVHFLATLLETAAVVERQEHAIACKAGSAT